jgi:hypothetical protein
VRLLLELLVFGLAVAAWPKLASPILSTARSFTSGAVTRGGCSRTAEADQRWSDPPVVVAVVTDEQATTSCLNGIGERSWSTH